MFAKNNLSSVINYNSLFQGRPGIKGDSGLTVCLSHHHTTTFKTHCAYFTHSDMMFVFRGMT